MNKLTFIYENHEIYKYNHVVYIYKRKYRDNDLHPVRICGFTFSNHLHL